MSTEQLFQFDSLKLIIEFCVHEIALQGLQGCPITQLFPLLEKSAKIWASLPDLSESDGLKIKELFAAIGSGSEDAAFSKNFLWRVLISRCELDFYLDEEERREIAPRVCGAKQSEPRGFCNNLEQRVRVNQFIRDGANKKFSECVCEFGANLSVVASQQERDKALCLDAKLLDLENLTDIEFCVLEAIAKSRLNGAYTTGGDDSLCKMFNLTAKQLHYVLVVLESHGLIKKQLLKSEKQRSIVYLRRFAFKNKTPLENVAEYLLQWCRPSFADSFVNIKRRLGYSGKQFKTLLNNGERQRLFERYVNTQPVQIKKNNKMIWKTRQVHMLRLSGSQARAMQSSAGEDDEDSMELVDAAEQSRILQKIGSEQSDSHPLYFQVLAKIQRCEKEGVALKQLGMAFGLDFYKSRRLGSNLQTNPALVTIMRETERGKAKYQSIAFRRFLSQCNQAQKPTEQILQKTTPERESVAGEEGADTTSDHSEIVYLRREKQTTKTIQALMPDRAMARKRIVLDCLKKNSICTKYEISKEIRRVESEQGLKGTIDSKTTKRILLGLESEGKLSTFMVSLKNTSYLCVRLPEISETDPTYTNYCATFKRTFDSVEVKLKPDAGATEPDDESQPENSERHLTFKLTREYINSVVSQLKFCHNYSKVYALVPKFQKAIILHRFIHYLLYFYDGIRQSESVLAELKAVYECGELPSVFQPVETNADPKWSTFIPPLNGQRETRESNCLFIGEMFSHMPLSVFCSIIVINHEVPGLVPLLKHPLKRHTLVKDLPPWLIAPLIFERRYLQRILGILEILACLGLVSLVESPCNTNQALNRDLQSQMVLVHRKAMFYDTTSSRAKDWTELISETAANIKERSSAEFERCLFEFNKCDDLVDYWRKLLHVSMNTYKFTAAKYLHEDKRLKQELLGNVLRKRQLNEIGEMRAVSELGDNCGPGGFDSQLFLNSFKNWMLQSNVVNGSKKGRSQAITKEADLTSVPFSELALLFPFGVFRGLASLQGDKASKAKKKKKAETRIDEEVVVKKRASKAPLSFLSKKRKLDEETNCSKNLKMIKAKYLVDKARNFKLNLSSAASSQNFVEDRRAIWSSDEDELILLIKVTSLYFFPKEKSLPFKLISDLMKQLAPSTCAQKRVSSFGRRIKILMRSEMNQRFVVNKLELCLQDEQLVRKYAEAKLKLRRNFGDKEQVELYLQFVSEVKERIVKKREESATADDSSDKEAEDAARIELPASRKEFEDAFRIRNSKDSVFENKQTLYKQPTSDYEISLNTVHSAIHSSILINDKNPRVFESFNLFDKYSDQLLTDVITKMSREHRMIAPTKCSVRTLYHSFFEAENNLMKRNYEQELKKKNVTAFSKHIGKAYHISQRYQNKWINTGSAAILNQTNQFKNELRTFNPKLKNKLTKQQISEDNLFDCTDKDDVGLTSFLAHSIENSELQVQIDVPNKIWVSKLL